VEVQTEVQTEGVQTVRVETETVVQMETVVQTVEVP
jgi:hypothetical protein